MIDLTGKSVLVVGAGISGIGSATLLEEKGALPILYDGNEKLTEETVREKLSEGSHAEIVLGAFPKELAQRISLAVLIPEYPQIWIMFCILKSRRFCMGRDRAGIQLWKRQSHCHYRNQW